LTENIGQWFVTVARAYKRAINPIGFIARSFIEEAGRTMLGGLSARTCLDIGAGTAPYESVLKTFAKVNSYIALDIAPSDRTSVVADCGRLPFCQDSLDLVVSFDVIQHIPDPCQMLMEARRVLKPGGYLILTYPFLYPECDAHDFRRWTVDGMRSMLHENGFKPVLERRRGGPLFALVCWLTWSIQHAVPGQRRSWRANRGWDSFARAGVTVVLTLPTQLLGWIALGLDIVFQAKGAYMGASVMAIKIDAASQYLEAGA